MKIRKSRKALEKENERLRRDEKAYRDAWARVIETREDAIRAAAQKDGTIKRLRESLDRKKDELDAVEADLRVMRAQRDALMEEMRRVKLTLGAANHAADVLEQRVKALEAGRTWPVDVDPVLAEELERKLSEKDAWVRDLIERCKEFRAEIRELESVTDDYEARTGAQDAAAAEYYRAFAVIAAEAQKMMKKYLEGEGVCSD